MKKILAILLLLSCLRSFAGDLTPGYTPVDGTRLTAAELLQLVNQATINTTFYTGQVAAGTNLQNGDIVLVVSAGGVFHKLLGSQIIANPAIFTGAPVVTTIPPYGTLIFYDPSNNIIDQITATNFTTSQASNIPVNLMVFAKTNSGSTNILIQVLPAYTNTPNVFNTNYQTYTWIWDTNGVPYEITYSNFVVDAVPALGTNLFLPYEYTNNFFPWLFGFTNAVSNLYGTFTNFPITSLFFTNSVQTNPTYPTLSNTDVIPILAASQKSNTTVSLDALFQYLTNRNTLPAYAIARVQFSGIPKSFNVTNQTISSNWFFATNNGMVGIQAISWQFSGSSATTLPTTPQIVSNVIYYAVQANSSNFICFTNYADAVATNHPITITGSASITPGQNIVLYLTNYTAFNADAIQLCAATAVRTAVYDVYYRTNLTTSNYYTSGSTSTDPVAGSTLGVGVNTFTDSIYTTNHQRISTFFANGTAFQPTRIQVLVQPE